MSVRTTLLILSASIALVACQTEEHFPSCPTDPVCREMLALKKACTTDADCVESSPWAACESDGFCTWHVCIPNSYGQVVTE